MCSAMAVCVNKVSYHHKTRVRSNRGTPVCGYTATRERLSDSYDIGQSDHQRWSVSYKCNSVKRNVCECIRVCVCVWCVSVRV